MSYFKMLFQGESRVGKLDFFYPSKKSAKGLLSMEPTPSSLLGTKTIFSKVFQTFHVQRFFLMAENQTHLAETMIKV